MTSSPVVVVGRPPLSIIVFTDEAERVHYALVLASTAAAVDRPARLFFAGPGVRALLPAATQPTAGPVTDARLSARGVATVGDLFTACRELAVDMRVCEMALRVHDLAAADLRQDLPITVSGAASLFDPDDGALLFVS